MTDIRQGNYRCRWFRRRDGDWRQSTRLQSPSTANDSSAIAPAAAPPARSTPRVDRPVDTIAAVSVPAPELHARIKPILNRGADVSIASEEFQDATQFAAVAHAAPKTGIPFMVLKHRVLNERMSLADAIRASDTGYRRRPILAGV